MTSSFNQGFGNVIGTPRDQLPNISETNYLETEADMTKAVNAQIDENIKDTKAFYDDMVKIEELKARAFDKNMTALANIAGTAAPIIQAIQAQRKTDEQNKIKYGDDRDARQAISDHGLDNEDTYNNLYLQQEFGADNPNNPAVQEALADLNFQLDPDEDKKTFLERYTKDSRIEGAIDAVLGALGHDNMTNEIEAAEMRAKATQMVYNKIHVDALKAGIDITGRRYDKQFLQIIDPLITKYNDARAYEIRRTIATNRKADTKEKVDSGFLGKVKSILDLDYQGQDLTIFTNTKTGSIRHIAVAFFNGDMTKAKSYAATLVAEAVENNLLTIEQALAYLDQLPYTDATTKTDFESYRDYVGSLKPGSKQFLEESANIKLIDDAISAKQDDIETETKSTISDARNIYRDKYDKLLDLDRNPTRTEIFKLYSEFTGDPIAFKRGHRLKGDLPKWLKDAMTRLDFVGDEGVQQLIKNAKNLNDQKSKLTKMAAEHLGKQVYELTAQDMFLVDRLDQELRGSLATGAGGVDSDFKIHIDKGLSPESFILTEVESLAARLANGEFDTFVTDTSAVLAYQKNDMAAAYLKDAGLIDSQTTHKGEAVWLEKSLAHVRSGGVLYPEVIQWFSEFQVKDTDGKFLRPEEFMMKRLEATGAIVDDPVKGLYIPKDKEFLEPDLFNYRKKNGLHGDLTVMTQTGEDGELLSKQVLDAMEDKNATKGYKGLKGYDFYKDGNFGLAQGRTKRTSIQERDVKDVYKAAKAHPNMIIGKYGITGADFVEVFDYNDGALLKTLDILPDSKFETKKFDENYQDYLAFEVIRFKLNKMQSIRGMKVEGGKFSTDLTHFSPDELEALNEIFPRLAIYKMSQLQNLAPQIANIILEDIEKESKKQPKKKRTRR